MKVIKPEKPSGLPTFHVSAGSEQAKRNARHAKQLKELAAYHRGNNHNARGKDHG